MLQSKVYGEENEHKINRWNRQVHDPRPAAIGNSLLAAGPCWTANQPVPLADQPAGDHLHLDAAGLRTKELAYFSKHGKPIWSEPRGLDAGYQWPQFSIHRGTLQQILLDAAMHRLPIRLCGSGGGLTNNTPVSLDWATDFLDAMDSVAGQLVTTMGSSRLNEFRVQYAHRHQSSVLNGDSGIGPAVTVTGVASFGGPYSGTGQGNAGFDFKQNITQVIDNFTYIRAAHAYKFGVDFQRIHDGGFQTVRLNLQAFRHMNGQNQLPATWFKTLDWAVTTALSNNLQVILDEHDFTFLREEHHDRWMGFKREDVQRWFEDMFRYT